MPVTDHKSHISIHRPLCRICIIGEGGEESNEPFPNHIHEAEELET